MVACRRRRGGNLCISRDAIVVAIDEDDNFAHYIPLPYALVLVLVLERGYELLRIRPSLCAMCCTVYDRNLKTLKLTTNRSLGNKIVRWHRGYLLQYTATRLSRRRLMVTIRYVTLRYAINRVYYF